MRNYVLRRLLALLPTLFFASLIVFFTVRLIPGDVIDLMLSQNDVSADKMSRDQVIRALGLDVPMWEQYLRWVGSIVFKADLGKSGATLAGDSRAGPDRDDCRPVDRRADWRVFRDAARHQR